VIFVGCRINLSLFRQVFLFEAVILLGSHFKAFIFLGSLFLKLSIFWAVIIFLSYHLFRQSLFLNYSFFGSHLICNQRFLGYYGFEQPF